MRGRSLSLESRLAQNGFEHGHFGATVLEGARIPVWNTLAGEGIECSSKKD